MTKLTALTAALGTDTAPDDLLMILDVSDTTQSSTGTQKKITRAQLATVMGASYLETSFPTLFNVALAGRTTALNPGSSSTVLTSFRAPFDFTINEVQATLETATASGAHIVDVRRNGTSILNSLISIAQGAFTAAVSSFTGAATSIAISKGDLISFLITQSDSTARGPQVWILATRNLAQVSPVIPAAPTTTRTSGFINLSWTAPTNASVTGYKIERATDAGFTANLTTVVADTGNTNTTRAIDGTASPTMVKGTAYWFRVSGINATAPTGGAAVATASSTVYATVPDAPTIGTPGALDASAQVAWTDLTNSAPTNGGSTITGYKILGRAGTSGAFLVTNITADAGTPATVTQINGVNLSNGTGYQFVVVATNTLGDSAQSAASTTVTPTSGGAMQPPTNVRVVDASGFDTTFIIDADGYFTHTDSVSSGVTGYDWQWRVNNGTPGAWTDGPNNAVNALDFQNATLTPAVAGSLAGKWINNMGGVAAGNTYDFRVRATNGAGTTSAWVEILGIGNGSGG